MNTVVVLSLVGGFCLGVLAAVVLVDRRRRGRLQDETAVLRLLLTDLHERHGKAKFYLSDGEVAVLLYDGSLSLVALKPPALIRSAQIADVATVELTQLSASATRLVFRLRDGATLTGPTIVAAVQLTRAYAAIAGQFDLAFPRIA